MSWTFPNLLSFSRMALTPLLVIALLQGRTGRALVIFLVAGMTDLLDGLAARTLHQESRLGEVLDPIADKLLLTTTFVMLTIPGIHEGVLIPVWLTVLVIARDIGILVVAAAMFLTVRVSSFPPMPLSKVNTGAQILAVLLALTSGLVAGLELPATICFYLVGALTVVTGLQYVLRSEQQIEGAPDEAS